jgi:hypothetical protein
LPAKTHEAHSSPLNAPVLMQSEIFTEPAHEILILQNIRIMQLGFVYTLKSCIGHYIQSADIPDNLTLSLGEDFVRGNDFQ